MCKVKINDMSTSETEYPLKKIKSSQLTSYVPPFSFKLKGCGIECREISPNQKKYNFNGI